jgi:hydroxymethylpyrimidine pyrophosphatase-like HAD family hydrolase
LDAVVWQPQDRGKAVAVAARVARDGHDLDSVLAVGDGDNDAELLGSSAVGVAVAGASEAAIAAATVRLTSSLTGYLMTFDKEAHVR